MCFIYVLKLWLGKYFVSIIFQKPNVLHIANLSKHGKCHWCHKFLPCLFFYYLNVGLAVKLRCEWVVSEAKKSSKCNGARSQCKLPTNKQVEHWAHFLTKKEWKWQPLTENRTHTTPKFVNVTADSSLGLKNVFRVCNQAEQKSIVTSGSFIVALTIYQLINSSFSVEKLKILGIRITNCN